DQALAWYRKAADRGLGPAQFTLASMYRKGQGTEANEEEAINWYRKASSNGMSAQAQKVLAWMGAN
ncbi:MAG: sel1 repeat family protein, partial [Deltaproteobacteria bacterium]